jgi:hypothetical protein
MHSTVLALSEFKRLCRASSANGRCCVPPAFGLAVSFLVGVLQRFFARSVGLAPNFALKRMASLPFIR